MKSYIIGHRGAAGLALENSRAAIKKALALKVPMIEIDVRLTADKQLILCHDNDLSQVADNKSRIGQHTWDELKVIRLKDGSKILRLQDALKLVEDSPIMIEAKDTGSEYALLKVFDAFPRANISVASFKTPVLAALRELHPNIPLFVLNHTDALDTIHAARRLHLTGIALNFWTLTPHVYWLARRYKLQMYVYTVNSRFLVWFIHLLYPHVRICTDHPERFTAPATIKG